MTTSPALGIGGNSDELRNQLRQSWYVAAAAAPFIGILATALFSQTTIPTSRMVLWSMGHLLLGVITIAALLADRRGEGDLAYRLDFAYRIGMMATFGALPWMSADAARAEPDIYILGLVMVISTAGGTLTVSLFAGRRWLLIGLVACTSLSYVLAFAVRGSYVMAGIGLVWLVVSAAVGAVAANVHVELVRLRRHEEIAARQDHLTGLLNRQGLFDHLAPDDRSPDADTDGNLEVGGRYDPSRRTQSLAIVDLDRFKLINDALGHQCGDAVLTEISRRLERVLPNATICRVGGDEFAVIVDTPVEVSDLKPTFDGLLAELRKPILHEGRTLRVGASIGVTAIEPGIEAGEILGRADLAMYRAKRNHSHPVMFFDASLQQQLNRRVELEQRFREGLSDGSVTFWGQCVVRSSDLRPIGIELLARWKDVDGTMISPAEFIPIAEETGQTVELGRRALDRAAELLDRWKTDGDLAGVEVNVNISPAHLAAGLVEDVQQRFPRPDERLGIEFVETELISSLRGDHQHLDELRATGARLVVDDFGVGYSSLSYLWSLPVHTLKVDKSFIDNVTTDPVRHQVVAAISTMANALGIPCVAEGVESADVIDVLHRLGINRIQGFAVSRPEPLDQAEETLRRLVRQAEARRTGVPA